MKLGYTKNSRHYFITIDEKVMRDNIIINLIGINSDEYFNESKQYRLFKRGKLTYFDDIDKIQQFIEWLEPYLIMSKLTE